MGVPKRAPAGAAGLTIVEYLLEELLAAGVLEPFAIRRILDRALERHASLERTGEEEVSHAVEFVADLLEPALRSMDGVQASVNPGQQSPKRTV